MLYPALCKASAFVWISATLFGFDDTPAVSLYDVIHVFYLFCC
jgi:hypothetical protein